MRIPSFVFFESLQFLPLDCLYTCKLTNRGLCIIARQCIGLVATGKEPGPPLPDAFRVVQWLRECVQRHFSGIRATQSSRVLLPGMELEGPPEADVVWGSCFPSQPSTQVRWLARSQEAIGGHGLTGSSLIGVGCCTDGVVLSFGVVVNAAMSGPQSLSVSLMFTPQGKVHELYWAASVGGANQVHVLRQRSLVSEAIISSDPLCFGDLYEHNSAAPNTADVAHLLSTFTPFQVEIASTRGVKAKFEKLLLLAEAASSHDRMSVGRFVNDQFLSPIAQQVELSAGRSVCSVKAEVKNLTTPKGIWACSTGSGFKTNVDLREAWQHRSTQFLAQIDKGSLRGVLFDSVRLSWFPIGILRSIEIEV